MPPLWQLPATQLAGLVRNRDVSAREAVQAALDRLDEVNARINAVVDHRPAEALAAADIIDAKLLRWFTSNRLYGETRNPRDFHLTPGGSSGGAAAAVTAGIGAIAHGTDIAGSIRYPAYACGVHGLRPTLGRVPAFNASLPERIIGGQLGAVSGPLARSIADIRLALAAMAARDVRDPWWVPAPLVGPRAERRAAICVAPDGLATQSEVAQAVRDAGDPPRSRGLAGGRTRDHAGSR